MAASRIPPLEEVCGDAAIYFDPTDVEDMATAIVRALEAAPSSGVARARSFTWAASAAAHETAFRQLM